MKKKEIGILVVLILMISLVVSNITKSTIESANQGKDIILDATSTIGYLKENDEIIVDIDLQIKDNLLDKVNALLYTIEYDKNIFKPLTKDDFKIEGNWSNLEFNPKTNELLVINLNKLNNHEDIMTITFHTLEKIPNIEKSSITISNIKSANWEEKSEINITNKNGNTIEEIILTRSTVSTTTKSTTKTTTIKPIITTSKTTTKLISTTSSTTAKKTTTSTTTKKTTTHIATSNTTSKAINIPVKKTTKYSKKTTTKKKTTTGQNTSSNEEKETSTSRTTTAAIKENFFNKNNNANKKVLIISLLILALLICYAILKYKSYKNMQIFFILITTGLMILSPIANALTNIKGDITNDGLITIEDISQLSKYLIHLENIIDDNNKDILNLDEDNNLTIIDLSILIHLMNETSPSEDDSKTAYEIIKEIQIGWNLGNTLDSTNYKREYLGEEKNIEYYETLWGNPKTTKEIIDKVKEAGFSSIRVPVTYYDHILANGKIDNAWLKRVEEVVNYVLDNDLYCLLDIHHDTGLYEGGSWIVADTGKVEENAQKVKNLWLQIAEYFKDYDYKLIFEGLNETVDTNHQGYNWDTGTEITLNVLKLNQVFVDTVRSTGGKNKNRILAVTTYGGITDQHKLSNFTLPKDTGKDKIFLSVHDYAETEKNIDDMMDRLQKYLVDKNIPVMITEFGTKANSSEEHRAIIASHYVSNARRLGIPCYWWDDGGNYIIFDRRTLTWKYPQIKNVLIESSK